MRSITPKAAEGAALPITRPIILVEFLFTQPLRVSSRETLTFQSNLYTNAGVLYDDQTVRLYNEGAQYTARFMQTRGHLLVNVWGSYGEAPFVDADWYEEFSGEVGAREFADWITCQLKLVSTRPEPHFSVGRPVFNHLLRRGTRVEFPTGSYEV